jgi:aminoglycoside 6-adenylyltransferase
MKTRTEEEMLALIIDFANADDRVRAVLINGSRVNPKLGKDPFQDYDIANLVTQVEPFRDEGYVLPHFGEAIVVEQPLIGPWPPAGGGDSYYNYNMQLADGNRIDLSFFHLDTLADRLKDSLTEILLDKDGIVPPIPPANGSSYYIAKPTRQLYDGCCTGFLFALGSHIPKTIWRKNLPSLKFLIEGWLREPLLMMLGWEVGIRSGWEQSLGFKGKYLQSCMAPEAWNEYKETFVDSDFGKLWESLFLFHRIFETSAQFVAQSCGFSFPREKSAQVLAFLEHVKTLPEDATRIY